MVAGENGHENLHAGYLARFDIHYLQIVTGIVHIHLVASKVFHMPYRLQLILVTADCTLEVGVLVTLRMFADIVTLALGGANESGCSNITAVR